MKVRAVICDVYRTLLEVTPPADDAAARWRWLCQGTFGTAPRMDMATFMAACTEITERERNAARARGINCPEVYWPRILNEVLPELTHLSRPARDNFEWSQAKLMHTTTLVPQAGSVIRLLRGSGVLLGIASNAQPYTVRELGDALNGIGLGLDVFRRELTFWSFEHGFSKPDPYVFQLLTARLRSQGIENSEVLMLGDREDNDIAPARACGWKVFQLTASPGNQSECRGDWQDLARWLDGRLPV